MNLLNNPELLDRLATHYALGTLRGGARRRFETLAREHSAVRAAALLWQSRMVSMNELAPPVAPAPAVWTRIDNLLQGERSAQAMLAARQHAAQTNSGGVRHTWLRSLALWRGATAAGVFAAVLAVVNGVGLHNQLGDTENQVAQLQAKLLATPQVEYVAVLADAKSGASMLVTFDAQSQKLTLQRVGSYQEAGDRSLQLWALPPTGGPRSLGVLGNDKLLRLSAAEADVREVPTLAISLEPKGGVPSAGGPTGPVLFTGALIRKMI
jgi:anti-sigma-K factor RskA